MPNPNTTNVQKIAPSAANGLSVSPGGASFANGSWVEFIASASVDLILVGIVVFNSSDTNIRNAEFEIGVGGAGSEVAKGALPWLQSGTAAGITSRGAIVPSIPLDVVSSGNRVAIRCRHSVSSTTAYTVALIYYEKPFVGSVNKTTQPWKIAPAAAAAIAMTTSTTAWQNTSWNELAASTSAAWAVIGIVTSGGVNGGESEIDIGTGGAGSEAVVTTMRDINGGVNAYSPDWIPFFIPLDNIPTSTRVAVRARQSLAQAVIVSLAVAFVEKPL